MLIGGYLTELAAAIKNKRSHMQAPDLTLTLKNLVADVLHDEVQAAVEAAMVAQLPELIRRAVLPPYLNRKQLSKLTGWSARKIDYMRSQKKLSFIRRGRTVLFATSEV